MRRTMWLGHFIGKGSAVLDNTISYGHTEGMTTESDAGRWVRACRVSDLSHEAGHKVEIDGHVAIAIFKLNDGIFAIADLCTHGAASLSEGLVDGGAVECPFHAGTFDIRTGVALTFPCTEAVSTYPVRLSGDDVEILVPEAQR